MMSKRNTYVNITPIPSYIPRQLAIDFLHNHGEIIQLNPLVTDHAPIKAPRDAPADEFYSTWYEISQRIQYIPGLGKMGSGAIKFRGVFHDLPFGLQTHTYAPAGVDLRNKWQICGNQPGEPPEPRDLGSAAPPEGLYIREDVEIRCNVAMAGFVKKEMKAAAQVMIERLVKKAELLDSGALQGMMENGRLRTVNPADRSSCAHMSPWPSPNPQYQMSMSSSGSHFGQPAKPLLPSQQLLGQNTVMELPGDYYHLAPSQPMPQHPSSFTPSEGIRSPGLESKAYPSELPAMHETKEEHSDRTRCQSENPSTIQKYAYNPQDYAKMQYVPYQPSQNQQQQYQQR